VAPEVEESFLASPMFAFSCSRIASLPDQVILHRFFVIFTEVIFVEVV
jgi:hypothetical protein